VVEGLFALVQRRGGRWGVGEREDVAPLEVAVPPPQPVEALLLVFELGERELLLRDLSRDLVGELAAVRGELPPLVDARCPEGVLEVPGRATLTPMAARPAFTVRPAGPEDDATVAELVHAYVAEANPRLLTLVGRTIVPADEALALDWVVSSRAEGALISLVMRGESAYGTATLRQLDPGVSEIKRMYLRPEVRGIGLGAALLDRLVAEAQARGSTTVRLDSAPFQHAAHGLYHSRGFVEREAYPGAETPAVLVTTWRFFELRLTG
jgi:GNAT superfamily N-acetyltransferase